jgi:hypothetical protein
MLRNILAVIVGIIVGMALNMALIQLNSLVLFPIPPGTDMNNPEQLNAYIASLPATAFIVVVLAHLGQSFVGASVAARLGASHPMRLAMIVGTVALIGGLMAMSMVDGPDWMVIELPLYLLVAWAAGRLVVSRTDGHNQSVNEA